MQLYHHLCNRWIIVREKQAFFFIQCPDSVHITCVQSKIKDIDIFFHTLLVGGFWDYHDIALQKETQSDLYCTFIVLFPDFIQHGIGKRNPFFPRQTVPKIRAVRRIFPYIRGRLSAVGKYAFLPD